ncbi:hypothetical protein EWM64_g3198 [Hericium alpestre]|uniref:Ribosomal RNA-processing protein 8 n=1 Tax=Hericium alpestre TaxID=135208 RepID=A0A4Z0A2Y0_9AGAM|nr:hypothetical protein EWM64_g3198 [Hericium alpestre]
MALFEVPGWSVPSAPVTDAHSKKRKRPTNDDPNKIRSAEVNVEKLIQKLGKSADGAQSREKGGQKKKKTKHEAAERRPAEKKEQRKGGGEPAKVSDGKVNQKGQKKEKPKKAGDADSKRPDATSTNSSHSKRKGKEASTEKGKQHDKPAAAAAPVQATSTKSTSNLTSLQSGMMQSLDGARFRWINEVLYKSDSAHAHNLMREDPSVFQEYHKGFRHQVESWPSNPVSHYISVLSSYPSKTVIADLGCGEAALARALVPKGFTVLSFDLVSDGSFIIEADIFGRLPLPGAEDGDDDEETAEGVGQVVDVVVCALSLMGTNWPNCIREAWRILRPGYAAKLTISHPSRALMHFLSGELKIAEVASRFKDKDEFTSLISSFGFRSKSTGIHDISFMLGYEASGSLEQVTFEGRTPVGQFTGSAVKPRIGLTPILRAGLGMTDALLTLFPEAPVYHLGLYREQVSLQPVEYYSKLPANPPIDVVYLLDPLIATGGTAVAALHMIKDWGIPVSNVKVLCILASKQGLEHVEAEFPGLEIWAAAVDTELTTTGLISPGLGDTGDRLYNTVKP